MTIDIWQDAYEVSAIWQAGPHLVEVVQGGVHVGQHAGGRLVGDLDGIFQNALRDVVLLRGGCWLCAHEHPVVMVTALTVAFQKLLQSTQPFSHQVDILCVCVCLESGSLEITCVLII